MREFVVMTDSDTEIPYDFAEAHNLPVFLMPYTLDGKEELFDLGKTTDYKKFYTRLREGAEATTATRPPQDIQDFFEEIVKQDKDLLYICFSSKLSAHYELALGAREQALKNYPSARIEIVDSVSIAMGAGILVYHAVMQKEAGKSLDEIRDWLEANKTRLNHYFTVDSLQYLRKTGRLGAVTATLGTILDLKPVLTLKRDGSIVAFDKVKGRKQVVKYLLNKVEENALDDPDSRELFVVCHGDNPEPAYAIEQYVKEHYHYNNVWCVDVGPVIGCHAGPGVLAVLMLGKERAD